MLTTIAMTRGGLASAADWSQALDANASAIYLANPLMQPGSGVSDRAAQLAVDGNTQMATEVSQLTVTPHLAITRYDEEKNLDTTTGSVAIAFLEKGELGSLNVSGLAQTDSTVTSELGQTGITNVNLRHDSYNAITSYQYGSTERLSWQWQATGQVTRYSGGAGQYGLSGYSYVGTQFGPTWSFSERLQGSVDVGADRVSALSGSSERDYSASLQLKRNFSEKYSWHASAGVTRVEIPGSPAAPTSAVFEVGATREGDRVHWDLSAKRAVLPIGFGLLARQDLAGLSVTAGLSERSALSLSANVIRTDPVSLSLYLAPGVSLGYQIYSGATYGQATANWQYRFSPRWVLSATYTRGRARSYSVSEWANGEQARLNIAWESGRL